MIAFIVLIQAFARFTTVGNTALPKTHFALEEASQRLILHWKRLLLLESRASRIISLAFYAATIALISGKTLMTALDILGLIATCFTTSSFIPQVWVTWRTRDVSGISLVTYAILTIGLGLWLTYGLLKGDLPLVVANSVMVVLTTAITTMKIVFSKRG